MFELRVNGSDLTMIRGDSEVIKVSCRNESGVDFIPVEGDIVYFTVKKYQHRRKKYYKRL